LNHINTIKIIISEHWWC